MSDANSSPYSGYPQGRVPYDRVPATADLPRSDEGYVYVIHLRDGLYKIGKTTNPERRLSQHQRRASKDARYVLLFWTHWMSRVEQVVMQIMTSLGFRVMGEVYRLSLRDLCDLSRQVTQLECTYYQRWLKNEGWADPWDAPEGVQE